MTESKFIIIIIINDKVEIENQDTNMKYKIIFIFFTRDVDLIQIFFRLFKEKKIFSLYYSP